MHLRGRQYARQAWFAILQRDEQHVAKYMLAIVSSSAQKINPDALKPLQQKLHFWMETERKFSKVCVWLTPRSSEMCLAASWASRGHQKLPKVSHGFATPRYGFATP